jgi:hypothetical protein
MEEIAPPERGEIRNARNFSARSNDTKRGREA